MNIYVTFCQTFQQRSPLNLTFGNFLILLITSMQYISHPALLLFVLSLVVSIHMLLIFLLFFICQNVRIRPSDTIAIVFCGSQKSLTTGL